MSGILGSTRSLWYFFLFSTLALSISCGKQESTPPNPVLEPVGRVAVFASPARATDPQIYRQLQALLDELPRDQAERLGFELYVTTGATDRDLPTSETANRYRDELRLRANAFPDPDWNLFRKYLGNELKTPAAVVFDRVGNVAKTFTSDGFVPANIFGAAKELFSRTAATLALFGAPWCSNCKSDFPKVQSLLNLLPSDTVGKLDFVLYVTTGATANDPPTEEIAAKYREALGLKARALADPWRWKKFREYVGSNLVLPGAAILGSDGKVKRVFKAGATTFIPTEIVKAAEEAVR